VDSEIIPMIRSAVLIQYTRVTDGRTDRQTELPWHIRIRTYSIMMSRVKTIQHSSQSYMALFGSCLYFAVKINE